MIDRGLDRVFLDANVLFSAAYRTGSGLLHLWAREHCHLTTSAFAHEEARRNLDSQEQRDRLEHLMVEVTLVPESPRRPEHDAWNLPDKDVPILAAAVRARATHLLTGDLAHFGHLMGRSIDGVSVLRPAAYLKT